MSTWPNPERVGEPLFPDAARYHWLIPLTGVACAFPVWFAGGMWQFGDPQATADSYARLLNGTWTYGGPCVTPPELAGMLVAAVEVGRREAAKS